MAVTHGIINLFHTFTDSKEQSFPREAVKQIVIKAGKHKLNQRLKAKLAER